ncbi:endoribonuclease Dicer homolog 2a-like [Phalaenopsis equestris]|uniref:endoribonuclease Dicer homolog 2a-like n=1 Tax=Phalaenopsis equestris TaxID=78828 RepID=UPI0009E49BB1|nr:endoribonuclease Dicer homolog 2a-like [Phalaenopsis equestris]
MKAAESLSNEVHAEFFWGQSNDKIGQQILRKFSHDSFNFLSKNVPAEWYVGDDLKADIEAGYLTSKVSCLVRSLSEYRMVQNLRCIVFVQRVVTAIVLQSLLSQLKEFSGWGIEYMAGNRFGLQSQTRNQQMDIVDAFRDGKVNIIVATQILEEGLDVQSCNLVVRFDPALNVCSFIQSRGRARMQGSDYVIIVRRDDAQTLLQVQRFLKSGDIMREEALSLATLPCSSLQDIENNSYRVETTGSVVNVNSSVALIYFYCSRLPSDGYFKPHPRFEIDEESNICTLLLPKSSPLKSVRVEGSCSMIKQIACLEACKKLHQIGALSDHLVPVLDEAMEDLNNGGYETGVFEEDNYFPAELVSSWSSFCSVGLYHCYKISMSSVDLENFKGEILLVVKCDLGSDFCSNSFNFETSQGSVIVEVDYFGSIHLDRDQVVRARRFQVSVLSLLIDQDYDKFLNALHVCMENAFEAVVYLLIPSVLGGIDWGCVNSPTFFVENGMQHPKRCCCKKSVAQLIQIKNSCICRCMLHHSVVYTPHNERIYCVTGILDEMDMNSSFKLRNGQITTYSKYFLTRHGIRLKTRGGPLLAARRLQNVQNFLLRRTNCTEKASGHRFVELPAEICVVLMSPISINTLKTFAFIPSVMHRFQCMLLAARLKNRQLKHCTEYAAISPLKVLEAITTKKCREEFSLESLETVGDSFLKYVASRYLFKMYEHYHQGLLTKKREKIISNSVLCSLGRTKNLSGFIRMEEYEPKQWVIPGENSDSRMSFSSIMALPNIYSIGKRFIKSKVIADSVEALIGTYLIAAGEVQTLFYLKWLGLEINDHEEKIVGSPVLQNPKFYVNIKDLQLLLKYEFRNPSLLVEALTHGSYQVSDIPRCYQRLEFLGDAVLDYLITLHLYNSYPGATPGLLTDLRSASVNNDCYAHAAAKVGLNKHILHASPELHRHMTFYLNNITRSFSGSSCGWEAGVALPKVLADVIESIAGAIYLDSGCNEKIVWNSIRPLLEPLVSPDTLEIHPVRELEELCSQKSYTKSFSSVCSGGLATVTADVDAAGCVHRATSTAINKQVAKKLASKEVLVSLKNIIPA